MITVGTGGLLVGSVAGVIRTRASVLFAIASGLQCFALGSTFSGESTLTYRSPPLQSLMSIQRPSKFRVSDMTRFSLTVSRSAIFNAQTFGPDPLNPSTRLKTSTAAGCITGGGLGLLFRGPKNILPAAIMFSIFGLAGQKIYDTLDQRHTALVAAEQEIVETKSKQPEGPPPVRRWRGFMETVADMKWSPIKKLSDKEYEAKLQEKLIEVEADIALIDESITQVRQQAVEEKDGKASDPPK